MTDTAIFLGTGKNQRLYAFGETEIEAWLMFRRQIAGEGLQISASMQRHAFVIQCTPDEASEIAEWMDAPALEWV
jgi:hypothetical protein